MKYYLLQRGHGRTENTLHAFDTDEARETATIKAIFGEDLTEENKPAWEKYLDELEEFGALCFEGDPGLEWFEATPADS